MAAADLTTSPELLRVLGLSKSFGAIRALAEVDVSVREGEIRGLVGPNGSGKSTLFDCCTGLIRPDRGRVWLAGRDITAWEMHRIAREGRMLRSFQKTSVFPALTVEENLVVAGQMHSFPSVWSTFMHGRGMRSRTRELLDRVPALLELIHLTASSQARAGDLSYGQQKLLQFAAVLMPKPRIALLDEPFAGVNPVLIERIVGAIRWANRELGTTFLIIEHNLDVVSDLCPHIVVLHQGAKIADGSPTTVLRDSRVVEAYLGG